MENAKDGGAPSKRLADTRKMLNTSISPWLHWSEHSILLNSSNGRGLDPLRLLRLWRTVGNQLSQSTTQDGLFFITIR